MSIIVQPRYYYPDHLISYENGLKTTVSNHWRDGAVNSDYKARIAAGMTVPCTSMTALHNHITDPLEVYTKGGYNGQNDKVGNILSMIGVRPTVVKDYGDSDEKAINRLLSSIQNHNFNLGVTLAEGTKTIQMVVNFATRMHRVYRMLRKGKVKQAIDALALDNYNLRGKRHEMIKNLQYVNRNSWDKSRFAAQSLLELQYGWRPFMNDIYEGAKAFSYLTSVRKDDITLKGSGGYSHTHEAIHESEHYNSQRRSTFHGRTRYTVMAQAIPDELRADDKMGLTNPALMAWELTPLSFVYDWIHPIGNYLELLQAASGLVVSDGVRVTKGVGFATFAHQGKVDYINAGYYRNIPPGSHATWRVKEYTRRPISDFPVPQFPSLRLENLLDIKKGLVSLSLLKVFTSKR